MFVHRWKDPGDNHLVLAPTYKIMQQSTLPPLLRLMHGYGTYSKADQVFETCYGSRIYLRTGTDPDSIVGITNVRSIWGDEAGLYSLYFWQNIEARASFREAPITLTSSPYTLNWLYKEIVRPKGKDPKARPDVLLIKAASNENPFFPQAEFERKRLTMDPRRFKSMYGGEWERPAGMVYDCFDEDENQCEPFALPAGTEYVAGIDWGFTEPFAFRVRGITPDRIHYAVSEFYKSGLIIDDICTAVCQKVAAFGIKRIFAGPDRPENIIKLQRAITSAGLKCSVMAADNSKRLGLDLHYELIKARRYKMFKGLNPHALDEIESYHYPEPGAIEPDDKVRDVLPVEQNDHAMDADRYLTIMTSDDRRVRPPRVPGETKEEDQFKRIERLKRRPRVGGTESWS